MSNAKASFLAASIDELCLQCFKPIRYTHLVYMRIQESFERRMQRGDFALSVLLDILQPSRLHRTLTINNEWL